MTRVDALTEGTRVVGTFIMPCGSCAACVRGRDDICEPFFTFNRLRGALFDGETRLYRADGSSTRDVLDGWTGGVRGAARHRGLLRCRTASQLEDAAILGCASLTAYGAVRHGAELHLGERVVVVGTGGVGSLVVQFARAQGAAQVVAVDISEDKLRAASSLGATDVVNASDEDPVARVLAVTGGGADVAFEVLGRPETFLQAIEMLCDGGRMVAVGIAPVGERAGVEITRLVRRGLRIVGSYGGRPRTDMPRLLSLVEQGVLRPSDGISRRFPLEEADAAYAALDAREIIGRAIVVTGSASVPKESGDEATVPYDPDIVTRGHSATPMEN